MKYTGKDLEVYAPHILRYGLAFVFVWFGWSGLTNPMMWVSMVPDWTSIIAPAEVLVRLHGAAELVGGLLLFAGIGVRVISGLLFLNLVHTTVLLEPGAIMVRDVGLSAALLSLALQKQDEKEMKKNIVV